MGQKSPETFLQLSSKSSLYKISGNDLLAEIKIEPCAMVMRHVQ